MKPVIYQLLPRLFGNLNANLVPSGTIEQNHTGKLSQINVPVLRSLRHMGITHMWYTGVIEHAHAADYSAYGIMPHDAHTFKGEAGSPYAITDYYDIDPDLADDPACRMAEFESLVARTHQQGMKVVIDFVPNHVARQYCSDARPADAPADFGADDDKNMFFSPANSFYYLSGGVFQPEGVDMGSYHESPARASGNDCYTATPSRYDWYDTVKLNYGVDPWNGSHHFDPIPPTWHRMLHILLYWCSKGVDAFRCDMVHMVPLEFWHWAIAQVKQQYPDVQFIAEIYDRNLYRSFIDYGGFDYLYDKVGLYDTLRAVETAGVAATEITRAWQAVDGLQPHMLNFLENHDEQRFASKQYAGEALHIVPSLVVAALMDRGAIMVYAGQELGEDASEAEGYSGSDGRTTIFDYWSIPTLRRWLSPDGCPNATRLSRKQKELRRIHAAILNLASSHPAVTDGVFHDLMYANGDVRPNFDPSRQYAFLRQGPESVLLVMANFADCEMDVAPRIPVHAIRHVTMPTGAVKAKDLLGGAEYALQVRPDQPITPVRMPPHSAVVIEMPYIQGNLNE